MTLLKKVRLLAAKVETTIGTDASLASANAVFNAWDIMIQPAIEMASREAQATFGNIASVAGQYIGKATFKTDLGWDGTSTEPSWASVLLPACGWVDNGSGVFNGTSEAPGSNVKTLTIGAYINGKLRKLTGAMGTFKMVLPTGKMAYLEWEFSGAYVAESDASILTQQSVTATPLRFAGAAACSFNSVAMPVSQITIDAGNELAAIEDPTTTAGVKNFIVTNRLPKISADPEAVLVATQDRHGIWIAGTEYEIAITLDTPTNSSLAIAAPKAQIIDLQEGDRNGIMTDDIEFQCNKNGTTVDASLTLTFTAAV